MREITVNFGQSLFDIAVQEYGGTEGVWWLIEDNNLSLDAKVKSGNKLLIRDSFIDINYRYFANNSVLINNSENEGERVEALPLSVSLAALRNEINGSDGYIIIDVEGGTAPYQFTWFDGEGNQVATSQNLNAVSAGEFSVTVTDANSDTDSLTALIISIGDDNIYLTDELGNIITDENGQPIVVE